MQSTTTRRGNQQPLEAANLPNALLKIDTVGVVSSPVTGYGRVPVATSGYFVDA